ncbi:hypothetical protein TNCV_1871111 [Trichonephila clavipes]|nr:hypothetical protein TNCV_1871111 [Trichonephila clavipes]
MKPSLGVMIQQTNSEKNNVASPLTDFDSTDNQSRRTRSSNRFVIENSERQGLGVHTADVARKTSNDSS